MKIRKSILWLLLGILGIIAIGGGLFIRYKYFKKEITVIFEPWETLPIYALPVIRSDNIVRIIEIKLSIRYSTYAARTEAQAKFVKLQSAIFTTIYGYIDELDVLQPLNVYEFRQRVYMAANQVLGPGFVEDVRLDSAQERRTRDSNLIATPKLNNANRNNPAAIQMQTPSDLALPADGDKPLIPLDFDNLKDN